MCDTNARKFILDGFHAVMSPLAGWPPEHAGFNVNVDNDESA